MALSLHSVSFPPELMTLIYLNRNTFRRCAHISCSERPSGGLQVGLEGRGAMRGDQRRAGAGAGVGVGVDSLDRHMWPRAGGGERKGEGRTGGPGGNRDLMTGRTLVVTLLR